MAFNESNIQIFEYLDKIYHIKEKKFFRKYDEVHEWGRAISESLALIFSFDLEFCEENFRFWASNGGLRGKDFEEALGPRKLKCEWSVEMAQDLAAYGVLDAEAQLTTQLAEQIANEINAQILKDLKREIKTGDELISLVKCVGYEPTAPVYDPITFSPKRKFISMNYNDIINERQNNTHWQNWIRAREQDKKT